MKDALLQCRQHLIHLNFARYTAGSPLHMSIAIGATQRPDKPEILLTDAETEQSNVLSDLAETLAGKDLDMELLKEGTRQLQASKGNCLSRQIVAAYLHCHAGGRRARDCVVDKTLAKIPATWLQRAY